MKNFLYGFFATVILSFVSCAQEFNIKILDPIKDAKLITEINNSTDRGIPFPPQSKIIQNQDKTFTINLPQNYFYVLQNQQGEVFKYASSGSVTCVCSGGGCSPVLQGGNEYCVMSSCNVCSKKSEISNKNGQKETVTFLGIYNQEESPIKFIVDTYSENELQRTFETQKANFNNLIPTLFKFSEFEKNLKDFYTLIYDGKIPSFITNNQDITDYKKYKYAYVSIYGNMALLPVPSTIELNNLKYASVDAGVVCS